METEKHFGSNPHPSFVRLIAMQFNKNLFTEDPSSISDSFIKRVNKVTSVSSFSQESVVTGKYLNVTVSDPSKMGSAIKAYVVYKMTVLAKENVTYVSSRRFSEFYTLFLYLYEKYTSKGYMIPRSLEKSASMMTSVKIGSKDVDASDHDLLIRMGVLEKFMRFCIFCPQLSTDSEVIQFLEASTYRKDSSSKISSLIPSLNFSPPTFSHRPDKQWFLDAYNDLENSEQQYKMLVMYARDANNGRNEHIRKMSELNEAIVSFCHLNYQPQLTSMMKLLAENEDRCSDVEETLMREELKNVVVANKHLSGLSSGMKHAFQIFDTNTQNLFKVIYELGKAETSLSDQKVKNDAQLFAKTQKQVSELTEKRDNLQQTVDKMAEIIKVEYAKFQEIRSREFKASYLEYFKNYRNANRQMVEHFEKLCEGLKKLQPEIDAISTETISSAN